MTDHARRGRWGCAAVWLSIAVAYSWTAFCAQGGGLASLMALGSCALAHVLSRNGLEGQGVFFGIMLSTVSALHLSLCPTTMGKTEMVTHVVTVVAGFFFAVCYAAIWYVVPH